MILIDYIFPCSEYMAGFRWFDYFRQVITVKRVVIHVGITLLYTCTLHVIHNLLYTLRITEELSLGHGLTRQTYIFRIVPIFLLDEKLLLTQTMNLIKTPRPYRSFAPDNRIV